MNLGVVKHETPGARRPIVRLVWYCIIAGRLVLGISGFQIVDRVSQSLGLSGLVHKQPLPLRLDVLVVERTFLLLVV